MAPTLHIDLPPRYRVLRHIATGGMASVYAAVDETLGREVAVKVLGHALAADASARERFSREARAAARVSDHPNVVTIYDIAQTEGDPPLAFIVMELITGGTIHDRLRSGEPIPHTLALRWVEQTASALDAAHAEGMVHRDVKPANLLLDANGDVKVADFGIALIASDSPLTQAGQVVGTATYFSPEQAQGKPATAASDRYALAVVAYELLTGRRPFPSGPPAAQALARIEGNPRPATELAPGLPAGVDEILARGLARDPADRPESASAFVGDLYDALGPTASTGVATPIPATADGTPQPRTPTPRPRRPVAANPRTPRPAPVSAAPRGSNRAGILAAVAALLLVAGAAIAAIAGSGGDEPTQQASAPETTAAKTKREKPKPAPQQRSEPTVTASDTAQTETEEAPAPTGGDPSAIQAQAHEALGAGDYQGAADLLAPMVQNCPVGTTDPCAYGWYDYGIALYNLGRYDEAVQALQVRSQNPDQAKTVRDALKAAEKAAKKA
jgi:serine/threonine-protein kinase